MKSFKTKNVLVLSLIAILLLSTFGCMQEPENKVVRMSTTTSVNDSGLMAYLQPAFEEATGYTLEITSAGTGAAIEKGRMGDADILLVHSKSAEEEFIAEGFDEARLPFMYNFFVIVGPADDPAGVAGSATAAEAFQKLLTADRSSSPVEMTAGRTTRKKPSGNRSNSILPDKPGMKALDREWVRPSRSPTKSRRTRFQTKPPFWHMKTHWQCTWKRLTI